MATRSPASGPVSLKFSTHDADTHKSDKESDGKSDKDEPDTHKSDKDSGERADAAPKAKDHSANGKADDAADSARHGDKTEADKAEADKPTSDKFHEDDDAAHLYAVEHPKDTDDTHKSNQDEKYEDLYDHSHDKDGPDSSYNPETDPHSKPDPKQDSSINQSEGFPEGVDPYRTPPKTQRQLEEALEAWESYQKKVLSDDAAKWHLGRYGFDDVVNPERALGYNPDGSPRSMEDFVNVYYDKEKKQPVRPWDVEELRKNGAKLNANYHEYTSITPFIKTHCEDLWLFIIEGVGVVCGVGRVVAG